MNRQAKSSLRNDKKEWYGRLPMNFDFQPTATTWERFIRKRTRYLGNDPSRSQIRDVIDVITNDKGATLHRCSEHFEGLLKADEPKKTLDFTAYAVPEELDINTEPPSKQWRNFAWGCPWAMDCWVAHRGFSFYVVLGHFCKTFYPRPPCWFPFA